MRSKSRGQTYKLQKRILSWLGQTKINMPIFSHIGNIFKEYLILPMVYHGGKLDGTDCLELIHPAKPIFLPIETQLLS
jgi:hypothetical protein